MPHAALPSFVERKLERLCHRDADAGDSRLSPWLVAWRLPAARRSIALGRSST
jgi:hypothetical protein